MTPRSLIAWSTFIGEPVPDEAALARAYADAGLMDEAVKHAVTATPSAPLEDLLAGAFLAKHRVPEAGRAYQAALRLDPDDNTALLGYARVMLQTGVPAEATHALERMLAIDPQDVAALETLGHLPRANRRSGARTRPVPAGSRDRARERDRLRRAGGDRGICRKNAVAAEGVSSRAARPVGG